MIINPARFHVTTKIQLKHMKSSMTQMTHGGMIINPARFHVTAGKKYKQMKRNKAADMGNEG